VIRHVVLRTPRLANIAFAATELSKRFHDVPTSVSGFLDLLETRLLNPDSEADGAGEVRSLWRGLKFAKSSASLGVGMEGAQVAGADEGLLGVEVLAEAIDGVFRDTTSTRSIVEAEGAVKVLDGWCWKEASRHEWPREAWELFHQLVRFSPPSSVASC
jgi:hypothetical protein